MSGNMESGYWTAGTEEVGPINYRSGVDQLREHIESGVYAELASRAEAERSRRSFPAHSYYWDKLNNDRVNPPDYWYGGGTHMMGREQIDQLRSVRRSLRQVGPALQQAEHAVDADTIHEQNSGLRFEDVMFGDTPNNPVVVFTAYRGMPPRYDGEYNTSDKQLERFASIPFTGGTEQLRAALSLDKGRGPANPVLAIGTSAVVGECTIAFTKTGTSHALFVTGAESIDQSVVNHSNL